MLQQELLKLLLGILRECHIDYMVTGSFVSSLQGEPRATHDIDIVIQLELSSIPELGKSFPPPRFYLSESAIKEAIEHRGMFNLIDTTTGDKADFWILTRDPFDVSRFARKISEEIFGIKMNVSRAEDTILAKLRWARLSRGSEKQFTDALRVFEVQYENLDLAYLEKWAHQLQVEELWRELKRKARPVE